MCVFIVSCFFTLHNFIYFIPYLRHFISFQFDSLIIKGTVWLQSYNAVTSFLLFKDEINSVVLCNDSKVGESGRKSASADDEETGEAVKVKKFHKNGVMFEEARRMLSSSLKKFYRCVSSRIIIRFRRNRVAFWVKCFIVISKYFFSISIFRLKQITKQEYKEIMKKGVTALSQRTKLDQRKVDEYATKYVECVVHRRKKRH